MAMKHFNKISDEELAAFLEGMLPGDNSQRVDSFMDVDTLEVMSVARKALDQFPSEKVIQLPTWDNNSPVTLPTIYSPLAMAGFLGDSNADDTFDEDQS